MSEVLIRPLYKCSVCGKETDWDLELGEKPLCVFCWDIDAEVNNKVAAGQRRYYQENKEKVAAGQRRYYQENKEKVAAIKRRYRQERKSESGYLCAG